MLAFILQVCGFETLNRGNWIAINALVVLLGVTVAALIYALANLLTAERREKLKGYVRYEMLEAAFSLVILIALILIANFACIAGGALFGYSGYTDLFAASNTYLGNLLFINGLSIMGNLFNVGTQYTALANLAYYIAENTTTSGSALVQRFSISLGPFVSIIPSSAINDLYTKFSGYFLDLLTAALSVAFGGIFILFIMLLIIRDTALILVAPVALLMRSLSFMGPRLRQTSNLFLAMAIGLYFVLPLMIATNAYVASCLKIYTSASAPSCNYPFFSSYLGEYSILTMSPSTLFGSNIQYPLNSAYLPGFLGQVTVPISILGPALLSPSATGIPQIFELIFNAPGVAATYASNVAAYFLMGVVLVALDLGITAGFIAGITKGLGALERFSGGPFFGG